VSELRRKEGLLLFLVVLAALSLRLWNVVSLSRLPSFTFPYKGLDAELYTRLARDIAEGDLLPRALLHAAPLYAYWLALMQSIAPGPWLPRIVQSLAGAGAVLLLLLAGPSISGRKAGTIAAIAAALYSPFLLAEGSLQSAALVPVMTAALILLLWKGRERAGAACGAGLLLGASVLNRPDLLFLLPLLPFWLLRAPSGGRKALLFLAGAAVVILPYSLWASREAGGPTAVSSHGGIHFYIGNHPGADGVLSPVEGIRPTPEGFARDAALVARREAGRELSAAEVSRHWLQKGLAWIRSDPAGAIRLLGRKAVLYWNDYEVPNNEDLYFLRRFSPPLRIRVPLFGIVAPFAVYGLLFGAFRKGARSLLAIFLLAGFASALLFFVTGRYRLPVLPALLLLGGSGAVAWWEATRKKRIAALLLLPLLVFCNYPVERLGDAPPLARLGFSYMEAGDLAAAEECFRRAEEAHPGLPEAMRGRASLLRRTGRYEEAAQVYRSLSGVEGEKETARNDLATLLAEQGRLEEAEAILLRLLEENPDDPVVTTNLGVVEMQKGSDSLAMDYFGRALAADPEAEEALANRALLHIRRGELAEAGRAVESLLRVAPRSEKGLFYRGLLLAMEGDPESALETWRRLEGRNPDFPGLRENMDRARRLLGGR